MALPTRSVPMLVPETGVGMNVRETMSEQPVCIAPETDVVVAALSMSDHELGALPVCEHGHLVGIITDRDIAFGTAPKNGSRTAGSSPLHDPRPGHDPARGAAREVEALMSLHRIRRLPVCEHGRLIGMISPG